MQPTSNKTSYTVLQAIMSPNSDEHLNIGIILMDDKTSTFKVSEKKMQILRLWKGEKAFNMMKRITDVFSTNDAQRRRILRPESHAYLRRYANNFVSVSPLHTENKVLDEALTSSLYHQYIE